MDATDTIRSTKAFPRMFRLGVLGLVAGAAFLAAGPAQAQTDVEYAVPDVLLLVDTSGSMARTSVRGSDPRQYALPACGTYTPNGASRTTKRVNLRATSFTSTETPPDRWTTLVSVLTGDIRNLSCSSQDRSSPNFAAEFALGGLSYGQGTAPYDYKYYLPYNRIVAIDDAGNQCTIAPSWKTEIRNQLIEKPMMWPGTEQSSPIIWRRLSDDSGTDSTCSTQQLQDDNGLLDQFREMARFGLMTFDSTPHWRDGTVARIGTGVQAGRASYPGGIGDTWSYFPDWLNANVSQAGHDHPLGCDVSTPGFSDLFEVGARNPAAPPWEGRLIDFGDPGATTQQIITHNSRVQDALLAIRPYGATPIAALLKDAKYFLLEDHTELKDGADRYFWGGAEDPGVTTDPGTDACRKRYAILLTDGGPNLDMRPDCARCFYETPEYTAAQLKDHNVPVYVIGFAVTSESGSSQTCSSLFTTNPNACTTLRACDSSCPTNQCAYGYCINGPDQELLATCCKIKLIADAGGTEPYFAEDFGTLYSAFTDILSEVVQGTRSRTQPVFAAGNAAFNSSGTNGLAASRFLTSFKTEPGDLFSGRLTRERFVCQRTSSTGPLEAVVQTVQEDKGDEFHAMVDSFYRTRQVYTVVGEVTASNKVQSSFSIRPWLSANNDGLGMYRTSAGDSKTKLVGADATSFPGAVDARALLGDTPCTATGCCWPTPSQPSPTANHCRDRFLKLQLGFTDSNPDVVFQRKSAFGAIFHSTPVMVPRPGEFLADDAYNQFKKMMAPRPAVLYAATTDGQLHAFRADEQSRALSELWTFMPPAVLPELDNQYTNRWRATPQQLLDGPVIHRDVPGKAGRPLNGRYLERNRGDLANPELTRWYSVLVGSFGMQPGYYALDVSWPDPKATTNPEENSYVKGPRFLWQLTTDASGNPLFGASAATPTIAVLYFTMPGDAAPAEHVVAILPGGYGGVRSETTTDNVSFTHNNGKPEHVDQDIGVRRVTRRYSPAGQATDLDKMALGGARSLTIVRLDTGEIVRTFRRSLNKADLQAPAGLYDAGRVTLAPFDAPIVGRVVAYPAMTNMVADRAFVGDAEGRLWRIDLSSTNPANWAVDLFFDAYPESYLGETTNWFTWRDAQPIETPPILSTDPFGRLTVAFSTGDQRTMSRHGEHPVWSLTETRVAGKVRSEINWFLKGTNAGNPSGALHLRNGERVTGPMTLFDGVLYFTTYDPSQENALTCSAGETFLWGVDYIKSGEEFTFETAASQPQVGPQPRLPPEPDPSDPTLPPMSSYTRVQSLGLGAVGYGVGVTERPGCYETTVEPDPMGFGSHTAIKTATPPSFQLVVQTGSVGTGGTTTKITTRELPTLFTGASISSWAALLE